MLTSFVDRYEWAGCELQTIDKCGLTGFEATVRLENIKSLLEISVKLNPTRKTVLEYITVLIRLSSLTENPQLNRSYQQEAGSFSPLSECASLLNIASEEKLRMIFARLKGSDKGSDKDRLAQQILNEAVRAYKKIPMDLFLVESVESPTTEFLLVDELPGQKRDFTQYPQQIKALDATFAVALLWHRIVLRFQKEPRVLFRTADILRCVWQLSKNY